MKEYRTAGGQRQLWYERAEIEGIMQHELHRAGLLPDRNADDVIPSFAILFLNRFPLAGNLRVGTRPNVLVRVAAGVDQPPIPLTSCRDDGTDISYLSSAGAS